MPIVLFFSVSHFCRYNPETNELISDEIKVAYPIINGIPNLIPQDARIIKEEEKNSEQDKK